MAGGVKGTKSVLRAAKSACFLAALLAWPRTALACGMCVDQGIRIRLPFAGWLMVLCLLWMLSVLVLRIVLRRRGSGGSDKLPYGRALKVFALLATVGYIGLAFLAMGSVLGPSLVVGIIWLIYVLIETVRDLARRTPERAARPFLVLNASFLVLAAVTITYAFARARSIDRMISLLDYEVTETSRVLLPRLIAKGEDAVRPLVAASEEAFKNENWYRRHNILDATLFCLGRVGGAEAESFLAKVVREKVEFKESKDRSWQEMACFAYAECAGARAVPDLAMLHTRLDKEPADSCRWLPVAAAARTASRSGVEFALDHMDDLLDSSRTYAARITAEALLSESCPEVLRNLKVHRHIHLVGVRGLPDPSTDDLRAEFYYTEADDGAMFEAPPGLADTWEAELDAVRERWLEALE